MRSSPALDRDGVMTVLERYRAAVCELVELRLDALDVPDLFAVLDTVKPGAAGCR